MKIKVLVIDDSAVVRETMSQILNTDPEIEVIGTASDPVFAIKKIQAERPDVITLDVEILGHKSDVFFCPITAIHNFSALHEYEIITARRY